MKQFLLRQLVEPHIWLTAQRRAIVHKDVTAAFGKERLANVIHISPGLLAFLSISTVKTRPRPLRNSGRRGVRMYLRAVGPRADLCGCSAMHIASTHVDQSEIAASLISAPHAATTCMQRLLSTRARLWLTYPWD